MTQKRSALVFDKPGAYQFPATVRWLDPENLPPGFSPLRPETWPHDGNAPPASEDKP